MANKKTSIGGQALIEGIMMRGPEKTAMAVRNAAGVIISEQWETNTDVPKIFKLPILRGVYNMVASMALGFKCMMRSGDIAISDALDEEERKNSGSSDENGESKIDMTAEQTADTDAGNVADEAPKKSDISEKKDEKSKTDQKSGAPDAMINAVMIVSLILGIALMVGLFIFVPSLLGRLVFGNNATGLAALGRSAFEGILKIVLLVLYMWAVSFMKDIRRTFMYHGAEHKTIFCYEHGLPLTVENIRKEGRFHPRCGTSFLILMLIVSIFIGFFIQISNPLLRTLIKLLLLPITVGVGYELIKFAGRHDNIVTRIISAPGVALQHITVLEPDDSMIECAIDAMTAVIPEDNEKDNW